MASLYQRKTRSGDLLSPFFYLKYKDSTGKVKQVCTKCRIGIAADVRRAKIMEAERTAEEYRSGARRNAFEEQRWENWVLSFLRIKYAAATLTAERYADCWRSLLLYMQEKKIYSPAQLTREHCVKFIEWRQQPKDLKRGRYTAGLNTALLDLKILRIIMNEAVVRGYCQGNPCVKLGIKRAAPGPRSRTWYSPTVIDFIRSKILEIGEPERKEFFHLSFEIARYQGCRLSETSLNPMLDVNLPAREITFRAKGGKDHTTLLHEKLIPLFAKLKDEGRTHTWAAPPRACRSWASARWCKFLRSIGVKASLAGACFHSLRHTVPTEAAQKGVPEYITRRYVGHASVTVHRGYQHLLPHDLSACANAIV